MTHQEDTMPSIPFAAPGLSGRRRTLATSIPCFVLAIAALPLAPALAQNALVSPPPPRLRDQAVELSTKIKAPFTVVGVGDTLQMVPISKNDDPDLQAIMSVLRSADMTIADNENTIIDADTFTGPISHMQTPPSVADDWKNMGIRMMTKANNHTWDDGDEGVWQDFHELDRVGIVHVGVGRNLTEARLAAYAATPKGTVALVGVYADNGMDILGLPTGKVVYVAPEQLLQLRAMRDSIVARRGEVKNPIVVPPADPQDSTMVFGVTFRVKSNLAATEDPQTAELAARVAESRKRHGEILTKSNTLNLTTYFGVTAPQMAQLRAIAGESGQGDTLAAFGEHFRVTPGPGEYSYVMNPQDERDILREVRTGKQFADFEVATIHWHQNRFAFQHYSFDHYPADFEIKFAHDVIDEGADMFFGHGVHTIKGVEIYKGKPIFYGVSNLILQEQMFPSWRDRGAEAPTPPSGPIVGEGENDERQWAWMERPDNFEALVASSHYENGKLTEVRIYPVDLGQDSGLARPGSQLGLPKRPSPAVARKILEEVIEYSKPFGTRIDIEDGVGVIHVARP
jgi:poly-gamma-glutamate capsule biosynthesis protein CapA/YwtB (metallophosphatase superfamily)